MTQVIDNMFDAVSYWQDKKLLLRAIKPDFYLNKQIIIKLLGLTSASVSSSNEAKKDMWNHQLHKYNMGDDILSNVHDDILEDIDFARQAIVKYPRTYIYLDKPLKASRELALLAVNKETNEYPQNNPILKYMPQSFCDDEEIATIAIMRNVDNLQYAPKLQNNKYFILDLMSRLYDDSSKYKVLQYINPEFLNDKMFVSKLGCFDGLCNKFRGDETFVSYTVMNDIEVLNKIEIFSEKIIAAAFKNSEYKTNKEYVLIRVFKYIEKFNDSFEDLDSKIKNKKLLNRLFWELAQTLSDEYL